MIYGVKRVVDALRTCHSNEDCRDCKYIESDKDEMSCVNVLFVDAARIIESLSAENERLNAAIAVMGAIECERDMIKHELEQVKRERDAAMGDLISRAAAIEAVEKREALMVGDKCVGAEHFKTFLRNRPTIDAEPVRHGQWIQSKTVPSYHSCSYCKRAHNMPKSCNVYVLPYYCMDCGAKMDGDSND